MASNQIPQIIDNESKNVDSKINIKTLAEQSDKYNEVRTQIIDKLIVPSYYNDVNDLLKWKYRYMELGNGTLFLSKICIAGHAILSFATGIFDLTYLSFISGCISVLSLVLLHFSTFSYGKSKEAIIETNKILETLSINTMPDFIPDQTKKSTSPGLS